MPRPTAELAIELKPGPIPGQGPLREEFLEFQEEGDAFIFRLADAENPNGSAFQARVEVAEGGNDQARVEGKLTIKNLTGLTIEQSKRIRGEAYVQLKAGYLDKEPQSEVIFFGKLESLTYQLNGGQLLWTLEAVATPGALYRTIVSASLSGQQTYAKCFKTLCAAAGINAESFAPQAEAHFIVDYSTTGQTFIEELRDLVLALQADSGTETVIAAPFTGAIDVDTPSFFLVDTEVNFPEAFGQVDLDLCHSATPEIDKEAIAETESPEEGDDTLTVGDTLTRFNVVMDFDSRVRHAMRINAKSEEHSIDGVVKVDNYVHSIPAWQTQFSGPSEGI